MLHHPDRLTTGWPIAAVLLALGCNRPTDAPVAADRLPAANVDQALAEPSIANRAEREPVAEPLATRDWGADWPDFLGPGRVGKSAETGLDTDWPVTGPPVRWQRKTGAGYGNCSVWQGRAYLFDRHADLARLTCLNAVTGGELWQFQYPTDFVDGYGYDNGPRCTPVIDDGRVYIFGAEGRLHCLDAVTGTVIWKTDTRSTYGVVAGLFGVGSTPLVYKDLLIVMIGGSPAEDQNLARDQLDRASGNGTGIVAFDKRTGEERYRLTNELASCSSPVSATINQRPYCFAWCRGGLVAFDPDRGKVRFRFPWRAKQLESVNAATPVVVGDEVFLSEAYGPGSVMLRVRPTGYRLVWRDQENSRNKSMKCQFNTPIFHQGYLYGCSGRYPRNMELRCVEWDTGRVAWSHKLGHRCTLINADAYLISLGDYGTLQLIRPNPKRFDLVAEADFGDPHREATHVAAGPPALIDHPSWAAPVLAHGLLYLRGKSRLVCLDLQYSATERSDR